MELEKLTVEQKFAKASMQLRKIQPFYSAVFDVIEKIETKNIDTMGVDHKSMYYNKDFVDKIEYPEFLFTCMHEIGHIALMHVARVGNRDLFLWNVACDLYVNKLYCEEFDTYPGVQSNITIGSSKIQITCPTGVLYAKKIDLEQDYVEKIYDALYKQVPKGTIKGDITLKYGGSTFTIVDVETFGDMIVTEANKEVMEEEARKMLSDAVVKDKLNNHGLGNGKGNLLRHAEELLAPRVEWERILNKYLIEVTSKDSSFMIPDKRMYYQSAIYPGKCADEGRQLRGIKICMDTSGSISDDDIGRFRTQIKQLLKIYKVEAEVIYWDDGIQSIEKFTNYTEFKRVQVSGGGGTDPSHVFKYFDSKKCKIKPVVILMLTDGIFKTEHLKKWSKKYKDTIWLLNDYGTNIRNWEQPFGIKASLKTK